MNKNIIIAILMLSLVVLSGCGEYSKPGKATEPRPVPVQPPVDYEIPDEPVEPAPEPEQKVNDFESCVAEGNPVMESFMTSSFE